MEKITQKEVETAKKNLKRQNRILSETKQKLKEAGRVYAVLCGACKTADKLFRHNYSRATDTSDILLNIICNRMLLKEEIEKLKFQRWLFAKLTSRAGKKYERLKSACILQDGK